jgi:hypothetical protein
MIKLYQLLLPTLLVASLCACRDEPLTDPAATITVTTAVVTDISNNSALSGGSITQSGSADITAKGVCWGTETAPVVSGSHTNESGGGDTFVSTIKNLVPGNTYYVRAYASAGSTVVYGNEVSFSVGAISPNVATNVTSITTNSAVSGGTLLFAGGSDIIEGGICWAKTENPTTDDSFKIVAIGEDGTFSTTITGLVPDETYYVRAYVKNATGTGYGKQVAFTTDRVLTIEDANFKSYLVQTFDTNGDGEIGKSEALTATFIDCGGRGINSLAGIEHFTNVTVLSSNGNTLSSVDLSGMANLVEVFFIDCPNLASVNMSGCSSLFNFQAFRANLSSLDLTGCTGLVHLHVYTNRLTEVDLSDCVNLEFCNISENQIESLDVRNNTKLNSLWSNLGKYTSLDVSGLTSLTTLDVAAGAIENLNVSGCTNLQFIYAADCHIRKFDLSGLSNLREFQAHAGKNVIEEVDFSGCSRLEVFIMANNRFAFSEWTFSSISSLRTIDMWGTGMTKINLSYVPNLDLINIEGASALTSLDLSGCPNLTVLIAGGIGVTGIDLSDNAKLRKILLQNTPLTTLDISPCAMEMEEVNVLTNTLTSITMKTGQTVGAFNKPDGITINYN